MVKLIVGLGNPGKAYAATPHNVGGAVVEALADRHGATLRRRLRVAARTARAEIGGRQVVLARPSCFMNESGPPVAALARSMGLAPDDVAVILDDADLPLGRVRLRARGGAGGHRGMASVLAALGADTCVRLRLGIGRPADGASDLMAYVLAPFPAAAREPVAAMIARAVDAAEHLLAHGIESAMTQFNAQA